MLYECAVPKRIVLFCDIFLPNLCRETLNIIASISGPSILNSFGIQSMGSLRVDRRV